MFGGFVEMWGVDHSFTLRHYIEAFSVVQQFEHFLDACERIMIPHYLSTQLRTRLWSTAWVTKEYKHSGFGDPEQTLDSHEFVISRIDWSSLSTRQKAPSWNNAEDQTSTLIAKEFTYFLYETKM